MVTTFLNFLSRINTRTISFFLFLCVFLLGTIDYATGVEFSFSIFYILPIAVGSWYVGRHAGVLFSIESIIIWFLADYIGGNTYSSEVFLAWNTFMRFCLFLLINVLLSSLKETMNKKVEREALINVTQKITSRVATHITENNSKILNWISTKQENGHQVSETIKTASTNIGKYLLVLAEMSYVYPYLHNKDFNVQDYINSFLEKIQNIDT